MQGAQASVHVSLPLSDCLKIVIARLKLATDNNIKKNSANQSNLIQNWKVINAEKTTMKRVQRGSFVLPLCVHKYSRTEQIGSVSGSRLLCYIFVITYTLTHTQPEGDVQETAHNEWYKNGWQCLVPLKRKVISRMTKPHSQNWTQAFAGVGWCPDWKNE